RRLPFPLHAMELITLAHQASPQFFEQSDLAPILKAPVDRAVIAIHAWEMVPLAASAQVKDDPIQDPPPILPVAARSGRWVEPFQQRFDSLPQVLLGLTN